MSVVVSTTGMQLQAKESVGVPRSFFTWNECVCKRFTAGKNGMQPKGL